MNRGNKEFIKKLDSGFFVFLRILCVAAAGLAVISLVAVTRQVAQRLSRMHSRAN